MKHKPSCAIYDAMRDVCDCIEISLRDGMILHTEAEFKALQEQLDAAQETIVSQQAKIDRAMKLLNRDVIDRVPETYKFLQTNNISALHEHDARLLEEAANENSPNSICADVLNNLRYRAAEYRAKVAA